MQVKHEGQWEEPQGVCSSVVHGIVTLFKPRSGGRLRAFVPEESTVPNPLARPGRAAPPIRPAGRLREVAGPVLGAWFSADGRVFGSGGGRSLRLFDVDSGDLITTVQLSTALRSTGAARQASTSGGQCLFACGGEDGSVAVFTLEPDGSGDDRVSRQPWPEPKSFPNDGAANAVAFSEDGSLLATSWTKGRLRIFDSRSGDLQKELDLGQGIRGCLYFSKTYLVGMSAFISHNEPIEPSKVRFWSLQEDFKERRVIEYISSVQAFAIEPSERGFAVGTADGAVRLYSSTEDTNPWLFHPTDASVALTEQMGPVSSLAFGQVHGQNCSMVTVLAIGWRNGHFSVYDLASLAQVAAYEHLGTNNGYVCCFSPDGGTVAAGGGNASVVLHTMRPAEAQSRVPKQDKLVTTGFMRGRKGAVVTGKDVIVYDCGTSPAQTAGPLLTIQAAEELRHLIEISPNEQLVAFSQRVDKSVCIYSIEEQREVKTIQFAAACDGVRFSPKGTYLVAWGGFGAKVFDTTDFNEVAAISDPNYYIGDCTISSDETLIATCGASSQVNLRRLPNPSTEPLVSIQDTGFTAAVCFNPVCPDSSSSIIQVAYSAAGADEHVRVCDVNLTSADWKEVYRLGRYDTLGPWDQQSGVFRAHPKAFSPDGRFLLCWNSQGSANEGGITIFSVNDPEQPPCSVPWNGVLATLLHATSTSKCSVSEGGGSPTARFGVGWWLGDPGPLQLYFACGMELITVGVRELQFAAEDATFSAAQLCAATGFRPDLIKPILSKNPNAINVRNNWSATADASGRATSQQPAVEGAGGSSEAAIVNAGDTVLHFCARNLKFQSRMAEWLQVGPTGNALPNVDGLYYTPIANENRTECNDCGRGRAKLEGAGRFGATAIHCAIANASDTTIFLLCSRLVSRLGPTHAVLLNDMLALLAVSLPEAVPNVLNLIDAPLLQPQELLCEHLGHDDGEQLGNTVRLSISRQEVRGSDAYMATKHLPADVLRERQHVWRNFAADDPNAPPVPVAAHVVALAGFLSSPVRENNGVTLSQAAVNTNNRTYSLIVECCDSDVYHCRIMKLATQFKWEQSVLPMQIKMMCMYIFCTMLVTAGMLSCVHEYNYISPYNAATDAASSQAGVTAGVMGRFPWHNLLLVFLVWLAELGVLLNECVQLKLEGLQNYWRSPWNVCDLISSCSLLTATGCHFIANKAPDEWDHDWWEDAVSSFGAVGVLFKWIGMMDYMRLWPTTAAHVRMIAEISSGAMPFVAVILLSVIAFTFCYLVLLPNSPEFEIDDTDSAGVLKPFVTVYRLTIGNFDFAQLSEGLLSMVIFIASTFFLTLLLLNMIIANMGDSYARIKQSEKAEITMEQARMITTMELLYPWAHTYANYMHLLMPARHYASDREWEGIGGALAKLHEHVDTKLSLVDQNIEKLEAHLGEMTQLLKANLKKDIREGDSDGVGTKQQ